MNVVCVSMASNTSPNKKASLYEKHKHKIKDIRRSFNIQLKSIRNKSWEHRLTNSLTGVKNVDTSEDYTIITIELKNNNTENWILFTYNNTWIGFSKQSWWINTGTTPCRLLTDIEFEASNGVMDFGKENERRMVLYHKLTEEEKEMMLSERKITIRLYHSKVARGDYYSLNYFRQTLQNRYENNKNKYPNGARKYNKDGNPIGVRYNLNIDSCKNFKQAYTNALLEAFNELVIKRRQFLNDSEKAFINTVREYDGKDIRDLVITKAQS